MKQSSGSARLAKKNIEANPAKAYCKDASLTDIFGSDFEAGRQLVDEIIKTYKARPGCASTAFLCVPVLCLTTCRRAASRVAEVPGIKNVPFFVSENDQQRHICRHPLNSRRQDLVLAEYTKSVQSRGIIRGVRGEAWLRAPDVDANETSYLALTFGTLYLGSMLLYCCVLIH